MEHFGRVILIQDQYRDLIMDLLEFKVVYKIILVI
jgi:hypothetical protein